MHFNRWWILSLALGLMASGVGSTTAWAQDAEAEEGWTGEEGGSDATVDANAEQEGADLEAADAAESDMAAGTVVPWTQRKIVLSKGMLRIDIAPPDFTFRNLGQGLIFSKPLSFATGGTSDLATTMYIGGGFGVTEDLEVGGVILPLQFSPSGADTFNDMTFYGRYKVWNDEKTEVAAQVNLKLPIQTGSKFAIAAALPVAFHLDDKMRLDTGLQMQFDFYDDPQGTTPTLFIPFSLNYNVQPNIFVGATTGFRMFDLKTSNGQLAIPLWLQGGYTLDGGVADLIAFLGFPNLITPDVPAGVDTVHAKNWQFGLGANVHFKAM